jgi:hypothetical protein
VHVGRLTVEQLAEQIVGKRSIRDRESGDVRLGSGWSRSQSTASRSAAAQPSVRRQSIDVSRALSVAPARLRS